jgi:hypothetical protein
MRIREAGFHAAAPLSIVAGTLLSVDGGGTGCSMPDFEIWETAAPDPAQGTPAAADAGASAIAVCRRLEGGAIVVFPTLPFALAEPDRAFLLAQRQSIKSYHKNIAYRPQRDRLGAAADAAPDSAARLRAILRRFSQDAAGFVGGFLTPYRGRMALDYASFRPVEEEGRRMRLRARNDLLHVDSFPTRPTRGGRIFRFFANINPAQPRVWQTSDTMEALAPAFRDRIGAYREAGAGAWLQRRLADAGLARPAYDRWMLDFHNRLKEDAGFQQRCRKARWSFPPGSAWMVFTDMASHSVLAGQYALEQTFIVDLEAMVAPERAPITVLRRLYGGAAAGGPFMDLRKGRPL